MSTKPRTPRAAGELLAKTVLEGKLVLTPCGLLALRVIALLHDLGKANEDFQQVALATMKDEP